jgi:hypothetical protein
MEASAPPPTPTVSRFPWRSRCSSLGNVPSGASAHRSRTSGGDCSDRSKLSSAGKFSKSPSTNTSAGMRSMLLHAVE